jgi:hypothetical protein
MKVKILSRVLVIETGFGFVFGFISSLHVETTINYKPVPDLHNLQSLQYNLLCIFSLIFNLRFLATDFNTGIIIVLHFKHH